MHREGFIGRRPLWSVEMGSFDEIVRQNGSCTQEKLGNDCKFKIFSIWRDNYAINRCIAKVISRAKIFKRSG